MKSFLISAMFLMGVSKSFAQDLNHVYANEVNLKTTTVVMSVAKLSTLKYTMFTIETPCGIDGYKIVDASIDAPNRVIRLALAQAKSTYQPRDEVSRDSLSLPNRVLQQGQWLVILTDESAQELGSFAVAL